jgi:hypothetical protein
MDTTVRQERRDAAAAADPAAARAAELRARRGLNFEQRVELVLAEITRLRWENLIRGSESYAKAQKETIDTRTWVLQVHGEPVVRVEKGRRYWRIVSASIRPGCAESNVSAYGFIDTTNGDLLKCDGWKKPAKHARGNLFAEDMGFKALGPYGMAYLR